MKMLKQKSMAIKAVPVGIMLAFSLAGLAVAGICATCVVDTLAPVKMAYADDSYIIKDSSTRELTDADVKYLSGYQLYLARNEIYARHGYIFATESLQSYFNTKSWYVPKYTASTFNESTMLSYIEEKNIGLIKKYEQGTGGSSTIDSSYIFPQSSTVLLTDADLAGKTAWELYVARNEIYARHGYIFENADLKAYFGGKSWYKPLYDANSFDENVLSYTEQLNIGHIINYEQGGSVDPSSKSSYIFPQSSTAYLTDYDLQGCSSFKLYLARNEIYARHGYAFSSPDLQSYFGSKIWYTPLYDAAHFNEGVFNSVEWANIKLIQKYESGGAGTWSNQFIFPNSHLEYLGDADLRGRTAWELKIARNEIYARHGYIFESEEMRNYFNSKSWYVPAVEAKDFDESVLSYVEEVNIGRILKYEALNGNPTGYSGSSSTPSTKPAPVGPSTSGHVVGSSVSFLRSDGREVYCTWETTSTFGFTTNKGTHIIGSFNSDGSVLLRDDYGRIVYQHAGSNPSGWYIVVGGTTYWL